ncbi:microtubule-actin cross-linking factor isoforms 1 2 3 5 isoform B [Micractinium conductrix]|uniref:Microtubule-actin cross-linking factor isoforms 1 2 3 5 isoform B n=1 Tax=Micractinium conductrix TaxID=554055 RepID=A0A2P6V339_9CHLO|nr:microtubule-actin cross-linking factor isoforms 1 2 3 5 isoform B [Micractinium conductrix]|eukprot:PSC68484.1 microtubule-actin cross-linking factor isoforms 1 2 3 5 isoform B [Micractinium conductrix]
MPIGLLPSPGQPSPAAAFKQRSLSGKGGPDAASPGVKAAQKRGPGAGEAEEQDLIAAFISGETVLPSPTKPQHPPAAAAAAAAGKAAGSPDSPALAPAAARTSSGCAAVVEAVDADASPAGEAPRTACSSTGGRTSADGGTPQAAAVSPLPGPPSSGTACRSLPFAEGPSPARQPAPTFPESSPVAPLPPPPQAPSPPAGGPSRSFNKSLNKRWSCRCMSRVRASIRRRLRRADSPPVPHSRELTPPEAGRRSPASAAPVLPPIPEAVAEAAPAAAPLKGAAAAAITAVTAPGAAAAAAAGGSFEEVDLGLPAVPAARAPSRLASLRGRLACSCFVTPVL